MIHQIPSYIFLTVIIAFIYFINSINLKKNRAIHSRAVMLSLKAKHEENLENITAEDVEKATRQYNENAALFNHAVSTPPGSLLNTILRYPNFEIISEN